MHFKLSTPLRKIQYDPKCCLKVKALTLAFVADAKLNKAFEVWEWTDGKDTFSSSLFLLLLFLEHFLSFAGF